MEDKNPTKCVHESKENFPKGFIIVAVFCYKGKLKLKNVSSTVKVN